MYRRVIAFGIIIVICLGLFLYFFVGHESPTTVKQKPTLTPSQKISIQPSPSQNESFCTRQNLQAIVTLSPGAGNIYGTFTLKNISQKQCTILGGEFIHAQYDATIKNISITHIGETQPEYFVVTPGQILYSQVHYPNGPQCQSIGLNQTPVVFSYQISPSSLITFSNDAGQTNQTVQTCKTQTDMTEIQIWKMATQPITPGTP